MDEGSIVKLLFSLQAFMFTGLIGVYIWSFKLSLKTDEKISKIYDAMNRHIQSANIHQDDSLFVRQEVFQTVHQQLSGNLKEIKSDVKELIKKAG